MQHLRLLPLWFTLLLLALGCRRDGDPTAPDNFSAELPDRLLGEPAEAAFFVDIAGIRRDAVYGPVLAQGRAGPLGDDRYLRWIDRTIDRIDVWAVGVGASRRELTGVAVLRSGRVRETDFGPGGVPFRAERRLELPTGAVMFVVESHGVQSALFLVDGSVVLAAGAAVAPTQLHFSRSRELPPPQGAGHRALAGAYGRSPALDDLGGYWGRAGSASVVWGAGRRGDIVATATFVDDDSASRATRWADELPEVSAEYRRRCPTLGDLVIDVERRHRTVTVRVTGVRAVLEAALHDRLCEGRSLSPASPPA
ncbi:MAG: hypothetical protein JNL82_30710 [Myxococcales bacterium]|nr:hypothetical protein [Myxococcales bacterium]